MIKGLFDSGALPTLERLVQFTAARHRALSDNIANLSTPHFKPHDLDTGSFQVSLQRAIDDRRGRPNPVAGPLSLRNTRQLRFHADGIEARPHRANLGVLFHDRNNRDLERTMQHLAENTGVHNAGLQLVRNQFQMLETAIRERV